MASSSAVQAHQASKSSFCGTRRIRRSVSRRGGIDGRSSFIGAHPMRSGQSGQARNCALTKQKGRIAPALQVVESLPAQKSPAQKSNVVETRKVRGAPRPRYEKLLPVEAQ